MSLKHFRRISKFSLSGGRRIEYFSMLQLILGFYSTNAKNVLEILVQGIEYEISNSQTQTCFDLL
jgi:hypothetical protein